MSVLMDEECKHGLALGTCSLCAPKKATALPTAERVIEARFDGKCPGCWGVVREGDDIGLVDGEWLCERCRG